VRDSARGDRSSFASSDQDVSQKLVVQRSN
jgi:hypothetical protein